MDLILRRTDYLESGIFGELLKDDNSHFCYTLEHPYDSGNGSYEPKVLEGIYKCVRGQHQLARMSFPFETFEITNVPGHTNILFHVGNYNGDSEGCVLLGMNAYENNNPALITQSNKAFQKFMDLQKYVDEFTLTVKRKT